MFVPLHDSTPLKVIRFQAVTIIIIALNVVIYLTTGAFNSEAVLDQIASGYGVVPAELTSATTQRGSAALAMLAGKVQRVELEAETL